MAPQISPDAAAVSGGAGYITVVAVDKDKHSGSAAKWAVDHFLVNNNLTLILVHVRTKSSPHHNGPSDANGGANDQDAQNVFAPFRACSARRGLTLKEVIVEDSDVPKALVEYTIKNRVSNLVLGASTRSALARKFWTHDVPTIVNKTAPDFCNVYVISKGKQQSFRPAARPLASAGQIPSPSTRPPSRMMNSELEDARQARPRRGSGSDNPDVSSRRPRSSSARNSLSDDSEVFSSLRNSSVDFSAQNLDFTRVQDVPTEGNHPSSAAKELEAEMKRLKLELKQTMDMYNTACKEAISAKQMAKQLHQMQIEEARRFEQAKLSEEAALAMAEMEKAKCKAAMEAAEKAQKLAEMEAQRTKLAEMKARKEAHEKNHALMSHDARYRKYSIEELDAATEKFSSSRKIGEGGYGPVYQGRLDHTPVAIKILRPDAAQGRKQFQQEVEILSLIRHPNMVLLLGACPEYGCLVYEYMNYGSLEDRLFRKNNTPPIPWRIRFKIASDIATGLLFLHQSKPEPLVHRDLKPANILLDKNYICKISDVGLARLVPPSVADSVTQYHMTSAAGTFCYIDPEYQQTGKLGTKSDIYSLGVLLLQIITARPPMGLTHQVERAISKGTFEELLDPAVPDWPVDEALNFAKLSLQCTELRKKDRPDLGSVVLPELNRLKELGMENMQTQFWS